MKKEKLYFSEFQEEFACHIVDILKEMKERGLTEIEVSQAEIELKTDYFFCKAVGEVGEKGESCGKQCDLYKPRNGISGCCKFRGYCYAPGKEFKLTIDGKLTAI